MKRVLCPQLPKPGRPVHLPESEADHLTRVLRLRDGAILQALDGQGHSALVVLRTQGGARIEFKSDVISQDSGANQPVPLILEMAILKGEAMEWVVEKAVELGVRTLVPVLTAHTVVQLKSKGPEAFQQRWQKIADQALKQCGRLEKMEVSLPIELESLLTHHPAGDQTPRLWCDEAGKDEVQTLLPWLEERFSVATKAGPIRLLIGPEGGWSESEREMLGREKASRMSLGPLVLRAETAALFGTSLLTAFYRKN